MHDLWIFCADIGSVKSGKFGWAGLSASGDAISGSRIEELAKEVSDLLNSGSKVALGFECPLYVPIRNEPDCLTKARKGEGNRPWSAGAGCGALATGLVEVVWILSSIRALMTSTQPFFLEWSEFDSADRGIFLWEAFITGSSKGNSHSQDAEIAITAFRKALPNPEEQNAITETEVFSLIGASILRAGWSEDAHLVFQQCTVIKP